MILLITGAAIAAVFFIIGVSLGIWLGEEEQDDNRYKEG